MKNWPTSSPESREQLPKFFLIEIKPKTGRAGELYDPLDLFSNVLPAHGEEQRFGRVEGSPQTLKISREQLIQSYSTMAAFHRVGMYGFRNHFESQYPGLMDKLLAKIKLSADTGELGLNLRIELMQRSYRDATSQIISGDKKEISREIEQSKRISSYSDKSLQTTLLMHLIMHYGMRESTPTSVYSFIHSAGVVDAEFEELNMELDAALKSIYPYFRYFKYTLDYLYALPQSLVSTTLAKILYILMTDDSNLVSKEAKFIVMNLSLNGSYVGEKGSRKLSQSVLLKFAELIDQIDVGETILNPNKLRLFIDEFGVAQKDFSIIRLREALYALNSLPEFRKMNLLEGGHTGTFDYQIRSNNGKNFERVVQPTVSYLPFDEGSQDSVDRRLVMFPRTATMAKHEIPMPVSKIVDESDEPDAVIAASGKVLKERPIRSVRVVFQDRKPPADIDIEKGKLEYRNAIKERIIQAYLDELDSEKGRQLIEEKSPHFIEFLAKYYEGSDAEENNIFIQELEQILSDMEDLMVNNYSPSECVEIMNLLFEFADADNLGARYVFEYFSYLPPIVYNMKKTTTDKFSANDEEYRIKYLCMNSEQEAHMQGLVIYMRRLIRKYLSDEELID